MTNSSAGTAAQASSVAGNGTGTGYFGIAGANYSAYPIYTGRAYALGSTGIVLGTNGVAPAVFAINSVEVGRWSSVSPGVLQVGLSGTTIGSVGFENNTSGSVLLQAPNSVVLSGTVTLPNATDTLTGKATADTLTNKTLASSTDTLGGVTMGLGSDATGDVYYQLRRRPHPASHRHLRLRPHRVRRPAGVGDGGGRLQHQRRLHDALRRRPEPVCLRCRRRSRRNHGLQQRRSPDQRRRHTLVRYGAGRERGHWRHRERLGGIYPNDRLRERHRFNLHLSDRPLQNAGQNGLVQHPNTRCRQALASAGRRSRSPDSH